MARGNLFGDGWRLVGSRFCKEWPLWGERGFLDGPGLSFGDDGSHRLGVLSRDFFFQGIDGIFECLVFNNDKGGRLLLKSFTDGVGVNKIRIEPGAQGNCTNHSQ